ncbi:inorganic phosphate transporter [Legionella geestiana]|uniref:Inorganic phosphate transporter n=1 Tax=Legionella geestiana TaxID=45065 RepID=A0A0W0TS81_9GAMM|nr:inorganic phosphate transporter [Legionella geestiana]KTC98455.1 inorganic phosphate transporter [Legionella geestiana]QBS11396.1 inorganic phosphate transporter [Legionella geestiana]STX53947.1 inorganic phosphate transporter [Legionella geestiana]
MDAALFFIVLIIALALAFDFVNGFHDAANSIATIVTTGVLTPRKAVLWAAFFNFIAFAVFNLSVAQTIGSGLVSPGIVTNPLIFAALIGALTVNLVTWYKGLPSSSSHAIIGGLAGAAIFSGGMDALNIEGLARVFAGILLVPLAGLMIGLILTRCMLHFSPDEQATRQSRFYAGMQLASSALLSLSHGSNDAQKTMGIIAVLLYTNGLIGDTFYVPLWVVLSCQTLISLGTLAGGWRIVHTMGQRITELNRLRGCAAEAGAATMIFLATQCGVPVSTTHTVTGAIAGTGISRGLSAEQWHVLRRIFFSWLLVIPASGIIAALINLLATWAGL